MQIIIDIPEKWFEDMVKEEFTDTDELCAIIQHGTLLPKGYENVEIMVCDDAISRQAALECCRSEWEEEVEIRLRALPPVIPQ